jgi:hypothetical protein
LLEFVLAKPLVAQAPRIRNQLILACYPLIRRPQFKLKPSRTIPGDAWIISIEMFKQSGLNISRFSKVNPVLTVENGVNSGCVRGVGYY